jgi:ribA/ribD-fused uncharacterized protein
MAGLIWPTGNSPWTALRQKFHTHADIRKRLLATGDEDLVENAPGDDDWGCGADGTGQNRLGILLMAVRSALQSAELPMPGSVGQG